MFSTVDLPAPLGPMNTCISCSRISRSTSSTALKGPYDFDRPRVVMMTPPSPFCVIAAFGKRGRVASPWLGRLRGRGRDLPRPEQLGGVLADHPPDVPLLEAVVQQLADEDAQSLVGVGRCY